MNRVMETEHRDGRSRVDIRRCLQQTRAFRVLTDTALAEAAALARCRVYGRGELYLEPAEVLDGFYVVLAGRVSVYRLADDGRKLILGTKDTGDVFWFIARDRTGGTKSYIEILVDDTNLCRLPLQYVWSLMAAHPPFALELFDQVCRWLGQFCDRLEDLTFAPVATRLAHTLAERALENEQRVVTETHDELAWLTGASRAKVTKDLQRLRQLGLIAYQPHHHGIRVLDPERLGEL